MKRYVSNGACKRTKRIRICPVCVVFSSFHSVLSCVILLSHMINLRFFIFCLFASFLLLLSFPFGDRQTYGQTDRQTDRQTDIQTDRQTDRQTDISHRLTDDKQTDISQSIRRRRPPPTRLRYLLGATPPTDPFYSHQVTF